MRTRWSTPAWRFLACGCSVRLHYMEGGFLDLPLREALKKGLDYVESFSIIYPTTEPSTKRDLQAKSLVMQICSMAEDVGVPVTVEDF